MAAYPFALGQPLCSASSGGDLSQKARSARRTTRPANHYDRNRSGRSCIRSSSIVNLSSGLRRKAAQRDNRERVIRRLSPLVTTLKLFEGSLRCAIHCAPCRIRSRQKTVAEVECKPIEIQPAAWRFVENLPSSALPSLSRTLIGR